MTEKDNNTDAQSARYLPRILRAQVYDVAIESPLEPAPRLSERVGARVWLKREDLQPVFSFKLRGAYNKLAQLPEERIANGVICASAGNHAQGVALAAREKGVPAVVFRPESTPTIKVRAVESLGGEVQLTGATRLPRIPLAYGFRDGAKFWFTEHKRPFWFPTPTDKGPKEESVLYEANRLDPDVTFTRDACKQLTGIPKPFLKTALKGIIKRAKEDGVSEIDVDYVKKLNDERG